MVTTIGAARGRTGTTSTLTTTGALAVGAQFAVPLAGWSTGGGGGSTTSAVLPV
jgi:hypothetical protein